MSQNEPNLPNNEEYVRKVEGEETVSKDGEA